jgi:hypothetical protein
MNSIKLKYLVFLLVFLKVSCNSTQTGCTDPMASNFDTTAAEDDNSCVYDTVYRSPDWSVEISEQIGETSGLIIWDEHLWTINDNSDTRLYALDTSSGEIITDFMLSGVVNRDWEEIAQDEDFIYVGDIGNNRGNRTDLHILRIDKPSLLSGDPSIDTIWFSFSDQQNFDPAGAQQTEFDCEAFVVSSDSIYLFTKQWLSGFTTQYSLSKLPGTYVAQKRSSFDTMGQVTGATFMEQEGLLIVCGYTGLVQPFLYLFYDYQDYEFFSGVRQRVNISLPFHQVEGVTTSNGTGCYFSNESSTFNQIAKLPPKLHYIDLSEFLGDYLNKGQ